MEGFHVLIHMAFNNKSSKPSKTYVLFCSCTVKLKSITQRSESNVLLKVINELTKIKSWFLVLRDVDKCITEEHGCEQVCINTVGSYFCKCRRGYYLHQDGRTFLGRILIYTRCNI